MSIKDYFNSQKGVTPTGAIIFIIIAALLALLALQAGKPFLYSLSFNSELKNIVKNSITKNDRQLLKVVKTGARDRSFTLNDSDIIITRGYDNESLKLELKYTYDLTLPFYEKTLVFNFSSEQYIEGSGGEKQGVKKKQEKTKGFFNKVKEILGI